MNRGRRGEKVFHDNQDRAIFVDLLEETVDTWNIQIPACCLRPNHILEQTPDANLYRGMRHIIYLSQSCLNNSFERLALIRSHLNPIKT